MDNLNQLSGKQACKDNDLDIICAWFREKQYDKNEYLSRPGEVAHKLYFIEKGSVILGQETDGRIVTIEPQSLSRLRTAQKNDPQA